MNTSSHTTNRKVTNDIVFSPADPSPLDDRAKIGVENSNPAQSS